MRRNKKMAVDFLPDVDEPSINDFVEETDSFNTENISSEQLVNEEEKVAETSDFKAENEVETVEIEQEEQEEVKNETDSMFELDSDDEEEEIVEEIVEEPKAIMEEKQEETIDNILEDYVTNEEEIVTEKEEEQEEIINDLPTEIKKNVAVEEEIIDREEEEQEEKPLEDIIIEDNGQIAGTLAEDKDGEIKYFPVECILNEKIEFSQRKPQREEKVQETLVINNNGNYEVLTPGYIKCKVVEVDSEEEKDLIFLDHCLKERPLSTKERIDAFSKEKDIYLSLGETEEDTLDMIASLNNKDKDDIISIISLQNLIPELMAMVDKGISIYGAKMLAEKKKEEQSIIYNTIKSNNVLLITSSQLNDIISLDTITPDNVMAIFVKDTFTVSKKDIENLTNSIISQVLSFLENK